MKLRHKEELIEKQKAKIIVGERIQIALLIILPVVSFALHCSVNY